MTSLLPILLVMSSRRAAAPIRAVAGEPRPAADPAWRREIVSRVQQHRARRRRPVDPNAMELDFPADGPHSFGMEHDDGMMPPPPERFHEIVIPQNMVKPVMGRPEPPKVIRFPRTQPAYVPTVEEVMLDELEQATPAPEAPRITMEACDSEPMELQQQEIEPPEIEPVARQSIRGKQMELLPSFDDIQLEPEEARIDHDDEVIPRACTHASAAGGRIGGCGNRRRCDWSLCIDFCGSRGGSPALQHDNGMHAGCRRNLLAGFSIYFSGLSARHPRNGFRRA